MNWSLLDTWIVATAVVTGLACALLGNFLVLRRMSMMGRCWAISSSCGA